MGFLGVAQGGDNWRHVQNAAVPINFASADDSAEARLDGAPDAMWKAVSHAVKPDPLRFGRASHYALNSWACVIRQTFHRRRFWPCKDNGTREWEFCHRRFVDKLSSRHDDVGNRRWQGLLPRLPPGRGIAQGIESTACAPSHNFSIAAIPCLMRSPRAKRLSEYRFGMPRPNGRERRA